ncbi:sensor histidine kinase [Luteolibacter sp. GHJ8]|uniref:histidine kinase n=2 Tax=Luteolibacter rhizosphaerae TaxID=2989719 RepID=A0ABT3GAV6_9BACT|nr:sensor histidine kinase [Luteolibacter rhizosphaerae]
MRLHEFLDSNMEPVLQQWEDFARSVWPSDAPTVKLLRDHAEEMLRAVIVDLQTDQSDAQQFLKSTGHGEDSRSSLSVNRSSERHAVSRVESGFDIRALVAEYRALRASVLNLWAATPDVEETDRLKDMTRFNEAIDQLLAESIYSYSKEIDHSREMFLGILGHDLRTPMHSAVLGAEMLASHPDLSEMPRKIARQITISVREMERMIRDLLDFTTTRLGAKMNLVPVEMDLFELGREVMDEMKTAHPHREFDVSAHGSATGKWDRSRLRQLLSNLIGNAVQHGAADSPIRLLIEGGDEHVIAKVINQGDPIPPEMQQVIFDPLRRNPGNTEARVAGSLGLGLHIAREVALAHGGTLRVESDSTATTFVTRLPRVAKALPEN